MGNIVFTMLRSRLHEVLSGALVCATKDITRPNLCGVLLTKTKEGLLRVVATDGRRMLRVDCYVPVEGELDVLISASDISDLVKVLKQSKERKGEGEIHVSVLRGENGALVWKVRHHTVITSKVDETFPPYDNVIPSKKLLGDDGCALIGFSAELLGDVANIFDEKVELSIPNSHLDVLRVDGRIGGCDGTYALMSMRI